MVRIEIELEEVDDKLRFCALPEYDLPTDYELKTAVKLMEKISESIITLGGDGSQMIESFDENITSDSAWNFFDNNDRGRM